MTHRLYQVDAFTAEPFRGNPAGVCLLAGPQPDEWLQNLAAEMNLSETAFLLPDEDGWQLRWFTPTTEVNLCGHATLASAKVLFELYPLSREKGLNFQTRSGLLKAHWVAHGIELDFPAMKYGVIEVGKPVTSALGFKPMAAVSSGNFFLFEVENEATVYQAAPDFNALEKLPMPEVIITARSQDPQFDFVSRFFAPQLGINEDPVTGSAHCLLAPYWSEKMAKTKFSAFQASSRGGWLDVALVKDRVRITGKAMILFKADLFV